MQSSVSGGVRHWRTFEKKGDADEFRDKIGPQARHRVTSTVASTFTVGDYLEYWKCQVAQTVKPRTLARYLEIWALHILPRFQKVRVRDLDRSRIKMFLTEKLSEGLQKRTVRNIQAVLRAMLNAANRGWIDRFKSRCKTWASTEIGCSKSTTQEEIKALTKEQRQLFLQTACRIAPRYYPLFFVLAGTGMRLGEALALQPDDIDYFAKSIRIARAFSEDGTLDTPKSGHGRTVDFSQALSDALQSHGLSLKEEKLRYGWREIPTWIFVTKAGTCVDPANVRRAMLRVLKAAKLPEHFTPHCIRHTYASILLSEGVSPVYVQEQLGHATIELTVSTYGRWLKKKAPGALDRLDFVSEVASGSKVVAKQGFGTTTALTPMEQGPYLQALTMEPATRIERATCGLRNRCSTN